MSHTHNMSVMLPGGRIVPLQLSIPSKPDNLDLLVRDCRFDSETGLLSLRFRVEAREPKDEAP